MEFMSSRPDVVRSSNQRWLLNDWNRLRGSAPLPLWEDLQPARLADVSADLSCTDVVATDGRARLRIRFHGSRIAELYGRANCDGKFLDEVLPPAYVQPALVTYQQVLATRLPVYTVADMRDPAGRIVHYERLLLPFSDDGAGVTQILASLETVSPEGDFENRNLMLAPARPPAFGLCTTIQH
ncbi:MAG: hypothetical protein QOI12_22 [Alphaproteobacteria bacterium]|jgi:hypothetical protein|nr:hypothetical protein [Alphaproteobacteria bacterium]